MKHARLWLLFLLLLSVPIYCPNADAALPNDAIATDFKLWWDVPIRAYTGLTQTFRPTYYEKENRKLTWSLSNAPSGMVVDADSGIITYTNPSAGTYTSIVLTATRTTCNSTEYPGCSLTATQTFTCTVGTSDFIVVSNSGVNNGSCGTIAAPCASIAYAVGTRVSGTDGETILLRGGSYPETFSTAMFAGKSFPSTDYMEIRGYPGETAILDASGGAGFNLDSTAEYVVIADIEAKNANGSGNGAGNVGLNGTHQIVKDSIVHHGVWNGDDNPTGLKIAGDDCVSNRVVSYSNTHSGGNANNAQNWIVYNDGADQLKWVLNSKGYLSTHNIKIKHTNASGSKVIIHNMESVSLPITGFGTNSSIRYAIIWNNRLRLGLTDPSAYTVGQMLVEQNTIIGASSNDENIAISDGYGTTGPVYLRRNISYQGNGGCGAGNDVRKHMQLWQFVTPLATPRAYPFDSDYNIFRNTTSNSNCWIVGSNGVSPTPLSFAEYQALTGTGIVRDPHSSSSLDPGFGNVSAGDLTITSSSPAATDCGSGQYCGAFWPDQTYGTVGVQNTTLLNFAGDVDPPTTTTSTSSTTSTTSSVSTTTTTIIGGGLLPWYGP